MASRPPRTSFGHTRTSTFRSKVREELICAICLDFLRDPKVLNCAHSFCLVCLDRIVTTQSSYKYGPGGDLKLGDLECPSCRHVTKLPSGAVGDLSTNYTLKRLVSVVSEDDKKVTRDVLSRRATYRPSFAQSRSMCQHHHRAMEYFCLDCNELLCPKCVGSNHKGHSFDDVEKVLPKQIEMLRSLIQPACEVATRAENMIENLFKEKANIIQNADDTSNAVHMYFEKVRKVIDQRESALRSTIQKYSDVRQSRLDAHYHMLQNHHDTILERVADIDSLIESDDGASLLREKQSISEEIELQEQSVMAVADLLVDSSNQRTLSFRESKLPSTFSEIGILHERQQKGDSPFVTLRQVIVSEEEDPYHDVPLRFEDEESSLPQTHMRVDDNRRSIEYEPDNKPNKETNIYNVPQPLDSHSSLKPPVPPRKIVTVEPPPVPTRRPRSRRITPSASRPSLKSWDRDYQNFFPSGASKYKTMPATRNDRSLSSPNIIANIGDSSDDSEDYEPIEDIPKPAPRTKPPPLPPNHPNQFPPRPKPKPRKRSETNKPPTPTKTKPPPLKKRSNTLPPDSPLSPPLSPTTPVILSPVRIIGKLSGPFHHEKVFPNGVCCCPELHDLIVITDVFNHCLRLIDSNGTLIRKIGKEGRSGGQFKEPSAVTVNSEHIYVTERDNPRVQKFTLGGKYLLKFGQKTLLGSQLSDPVGVALSSNGSVVVSDWDRNKIQVFSSDGKLLNTIGKENNLFKFPAGIAINHKGNILVTDRGNHCVWELTLNGDIVQKIGSRGILSGQLDFPYGVVVLEDKSIVISESGNNRISVFSESGRFIRCFGESGSDPGQFDHPRHLCVNSKGHLIVADQMNQRLQVFAL